MVLVEHCEVGEGGLSYENWEEAHQYIIRLPHTKYAELCSNGMRYVQNRFNWSSICEKIRFSTLEIHEMVIAIVLYKK